jgi:hypothetical protein
LSEEPEATRFPSGVNATQLTKELCPEECDWENVRLLLTKRLLDRGVKILGQQSNWDKYFKGLLFYGLSNTVTTAIILFTIVPCLHPQDPFLIEEQIC